MNDQLTDTTVLLDRSGSMEMIQQDVIGGFNALVTEQQCVEGEANLTLIQFDGQDPQEAVIDAQPIASVPKLSSRTYQPRGSTPLLDAMGMSITRTGQRLAAMPEPQRPSKVVFVIVTDGHENASRTYRRSQVFDMIRHQEEAYEWQFLFLAAEQDAIAEGGKYGFAKSRSMRWGKTADGVKFAVGMASSKIASYRLQALMSELDITDKDRESQADEIKKGG